MIMIVRHGVVIFGKCRGLTDAIAMTGLAVPHDRTGDTIVPLWTQGAQRILEKSLEPLIDAPF
jgi:hypothetical protein